MDQNSPQCDVTPKMKTTSYQEQYTRINPNDVTPFLGVDADIAMHANTLEENAAQQADRRHIQAGPEVMR